LKLSFWTTIELPFSIELWKIIAINFLVKTKFVTKEVPNQIFIFFSKKNQFDFQSYVCWIVSMAIPKVGLNFYLIIKYLFCIFDETFNFETHHITREINSQHDQMFCSSVQAKNNHSAIRTTIMVKLARGTYNVKKKYHFWHKSNCY